jgi:hypothetical protein
MNAAGVFSITADQNCSPSAEGEQRKARQIASAVHKDQKHPYVIEFAFLPQSSPGCVLNLNTTSAEAPGFPYGVNKTE